MPNYNFKCLDCGCEYETIVNNRDPVSTNGIERWIDNLCPECHSFNVIKILSLGTISFRNLSTPGRKD